MKRMALLLAVLAGIMWGSGGSFVRALMAGGLDNLTIFFVRVLFATIYLLIGILIVDRSLFRFRLKDIWLFLLCGCFAMTGLNICYNIAISNMSLSLAAVLLSLSPIYVVFLAAILFHERITAKKIICMVLAILGCVLVSGLMDPVAGIGGASLANVLHPTAGSVIAGILSGVLYAFYFIGTRIAGDRGYRSFTIIFYAMLFATLMLAPFADWQGVAGYVSADPPVHMAILLLHSLFTSALPYIFVTIAVLHAEAGVVSIIGAAGEPAAATLFGAALFSEIPSLLSLSGLVLTIIALALLVGHKKGQTANGPSGS